LFDFVNNYLVMSFVRFNHQYVYGRRKSFHEHLNINAFNLYIKQQITQQWLQLLFSNVLVARVKLIYLNYSKM